MFKKNKIAVITGVSEGIGKALSLELLKKGYKVVGISSSKKKINKIKSSFRDFKSSFLAYQVDVRKFNDLNTISKKTDSPDLLILNAGIYLPVISENPDLDVFKNHVDINYMGVVNTYVAFIKKMLKKRSGTILIMSSIAGWIGLPRAAAYAPTKAALRIFAQSIRYDLEKYGIKVKVCSPGFVKTSATKINNFYMPGLVDVDVAAKLILNNIHSKKFEITFPFVFSSIMKLISIIPEKLSYFLIKWITNNNAK